MSNILLNSKYYNRLLVNNLSAINIKANNISQKQQSYLYSVLFKNDGDQYLTINNNLATLVFEKNDINSIIEFTDRPFRQTEYISLEKLDNLFFMNNNNSFKDDPPNAVLVTESGQKTFEIISIIVNTVHIQYNLKIIDNEENFSVDKITGKMSLFIDNSTANSSNSTQFIESTIINDNYDVLLLREFFNVYVLLYYNTKNNSYNRYLLDNNYGEDNLINFIKSNNYNTSNEVDFDIILKEDNKLNINIPNIGLQNNFNILNVNSSSNVNEYYVFNNNFESSPNNDKSQLKLEKQNSELLITYNNNIKTYNYKNTGALHYLVILIDFSEVILYYDLGRKWNKY